MKGSVFGTWEILSSLVGAATLISLVKNGFAVDLHGLPAALFQQYTWMRDAIFEPVIWVLRYFDLTMQWWLKDLTMAYALITAAHWRALNTFGFGATDRILSDRQRKMKMLGHSIVWPVRIYPLRAAPSSLRRTYDDMDVRSQFKMVFRLRFFLNLALVLGSAVAFFVWNHLSNVYGPSG
jgi:hypothetical protein